METLNRHRKNHIAGVQHTCSACNASFKRKDLLDRHSLTHDTQRHTKISSRSGKACDRCSRLKTKCDGSTTCTRCERGGHPCTYKHTTSRARTGRSSVGTLSTSHSPSIDGESSFGTLDYSLSDPGDFVLYDQIWDAEDTWTQQDWTTQRSTWDLSNFDRGFNSVSTIEASQTTPFPPQLSFPGTWDVSPSAWDISESLQPVEGLCPSIEDMNFGCAPISWPQHESSAPQVHIGVGGGDLGYSINGYPAGMPCTYTSHSLV